MNRTQAIRLGGRAARTAGNAAVIGLEQLPENTFASTVPDTVNGRALLAALNLDADATRFLLARFDRQTLPWTSARIEATRKRVARRLKQIQALRLQPGDFVVRGYSSRVLSFEEHLPSGRVCWSMGELGPAFPSIMRAEREYLEPRQPAAPKIISRVA